MAERFPFPKRDRVTYQRLIDHPLAMLNDLLKYFPEEESIDSLASRINTFCKKYDCYFRVQVINWERIGLHSFFILTPDPVDHPYAIRKYKILGEDIWYFTHFVTPISTKKEALKAFPDAYFLSKIYPPTNAIQLLYDEARTIPYKDLWLVKLKESYEIEERISDYYHRQRTDSPILVDAPFLARLSELYLREEPGKLLYRERSDVKFIEDLYGFLAHFWDAKLPNMVDYLVILSDAINPPAFVGGLHRRFPLVELYETENDMICRFQLPDAHYGKISYMLFTNLVKVCKPSTYVVKEDTRLFRLLEQWDDKGWAPFKI